jgi:hypothetical protein
LSPELIQALHSQGIYHLNQIVDQGHTSIWSQEWLGPISRLEGENDQWSNYIQALKSSHIRIVDREDELIWKHAPLGIYTPKLGYIQLNIAQHLREPLWWWKGLWKV